MTIKRNNYLRKFALLFTLLLLPFGFFNASLTYLYIILAGVILFFFVNSLDHYESSLTIFIFLFSLLPIAWSIDIGMGLPILTVRRMIYIILTLIYLLKKNQFTKDSFPVNIKMSFSFLMISYLFTTIFALNYKLSLYQFFHFVYEQVFFMLILYKVLNNSEKAKVGYIALSLSAAVLSIFGLLEFATGKNYFSSLTFANSGSIDFWSNYQDQIRLGFSGRITSITTHPMILGGTLAIISPITISLIMTSKKYIAKQFYLVIYSISVITIILTISRSPILALFISSIFFTFYLNLKFKIRFPYKVILMMMIVILIITMVFKELSILLISTVQFWKNFEGVSNTGSSWESRTDMLSGIYFYFLSNPIFGIGLGNGVQLIQKGNLLMVGLLENFWLIKLLESGLIGLFALVNFCYLTLKFINKQINNNLSKDTMVLVAGGLTSLISFFVFATATGDMTLFDLVFVIFPLTIRLFEHN